jgi:hypothetical protein
MIKQTLKHTIMKRYELSNDRKEVNFPFGGNLSDWQILGLCQEHKGNYDSLKASLTADDGWETEDSKEQLIEFLESEDLQLMFPDYY